MISPGEDRLLDIGEAAEILKTTKDYLYRHWRELPFAFEFSPRQFGSAQRDSHLYRGEMSRSRGTGRVYQRGEVWWIEYWHKGSSIGKVPDYEETRKKGQPSVSCGPRPGDRSGHIPGQAKITVNQVLNDFEKDYRLRGGTAIREAAIPPQAGA